MAALTLVNGCGDNEAPVSPPYSSGSRLRANLLDGGDGAVLFDGWHDTLLDLDCSFTLAADEVVRCLPREHALVAFADPTCTTLAAFNFAGSVCRPATHAFTYPPSTDLCSPRGVEVHELGASIGVGDIYVPDGAGGCVELPLARTERFALGPPLDAARFLARRELLTEDRGDDLSASITVADDGARAISSLTDGDGRGCLPYAFDADTDVCLGWIANDGAEAAVFADPGCTIPAGGATYDSACGPPTAPTAISVRVGGDSCRGVHELHRPGPRLDAVYGSEPAACSPVSDRTGYQIGPLATADDFPILTTAELGRGRVRARYTADRRGRPLQPDALVDSVTGTRCVVVEDGDGTLRCLPDGSVFRPGWSRYRDAACQLPVLEEISDCAGPPPQLIVDGSPQCPIARATAVYPVSEYGGPLFEPTTTGGCAPSERQAGVTYYAAEPPITLDRFPAITRRIE